MAAEKPLVLISNDDGIDAPGIAALAGAMVGLGDVWVVAPINEQSAVGHSITIRNPVRARVWPFPAADVTAYAVSGTPADCVKIACNRILPRRPDIVVSGINHGPNTAVNVIYSGTVSAATEASILGIDAVAFSLCAWEHNDYEPAAQVARKMVEHVMKQHLPPGVLLNVNIPPLPLKDIKGVRTTRQARSRWEEEFKERMDPYNQPYYWLTGTFINLDEGDNTDIAAVDDGFISVTPIQHDLTAHEYLSSLAQWDWS